MAYGDQTLVIVQIDQPLCSNVYGDGLGSPRGSPGGCTAVLGVSGTRKCYNTRATCQDEANYLAGTLTLTFAKPQRGLQQYGYVLPLLDSVETTPGSVNLASMDRAASALGQREVVSLSFKNTLHSDLFVDKYRLERKSGVAEVTDLGSPSTVVSYDPYTRGTFWGKWLARNPYYSAYALRVYRGTMGQALADMEVRHYLIDRIDGPNQGRVTMVAKDKFSRIEAKKAVAPTASRGELTFDITAGGTSFTVAPTGIGDTDYPYPPGSPSEMYVAIGEEIIKATRSADTFTVVQRGALGTAAAAHSDEDLVQWVLPYSLQSPHDIIYDLLTEYGGIATADIDQADWDAQAEEVTVIYTGYIAKPTPVNELVGEICEQSGLTVWPDVRSGEIKLRALRARSSAATLTDDAWILRGSLRTKRLEERRLSQVWVYYGKKNPLGDHKDPRNYYSRVIEIDATAEDEDQFDSPKLHEVFSRWIPQFGRTSASETGNRILTIFRNPPLAAELELDRDRDGEFDVTDYVTLDTAAIENETGANDETQVAVISFKRGDGRIGVGAIEVSFDLLAGEAETGERVIPIENSAYNVNLRSVHDSLYGSLPSGSPTIPIRFVIYPTVVIGSNSAASPACRTGSWQAGTNLYVENRGRIQGAGGVGGTGGGTAGGNGTAGSTGGDALLVEYAITLDNSNGQIWGGGGGGGGGGTCFLSPSSHLAGGGGGGGTGTDGGGGGVAGTNIDFNPPSYFPSQPGNVGGSDSGGAGGTGTRDSTVTFVGGTGGTGGGAGLAGSTGGTASGGDINNSGSAGGAAGNYINGIALVTMGSPTGDLRGNVV